MRGWDVPTGKILDYRWQVVKFSPPAPQKHPANDDSREKGRPPGEMLRNPLRPSNQSINQDFHIIFPRLEK
jgi:hypothetical protein